MKRVAIVFEEDIFNQKGTFHAKLERARHLAARPELEVEVFCVQVRYTWIERLLLGKRWLEGVSERRLGRPERLDFDGVSYRMLWMPYSILDHFLFFKLGRRPLFYPRFLRRKAALLKGFDWISAHSFEGAFLAREAQRLYGTPYSVSWHGSDIHTKPFKYPCIREETASLMALAKMNFFVSRALLETSDQIGLGAKQVLYNGVDAVFYPYPAERRQLLKRAEGLEGQRVVAFVGNLFPVKQAEHLPAIFRQMAAPDIRFWIIGDGPLRGEIEARSGDTVRFWGDVPHSRMPEILNMVDLVILPSRNEGFGMVLAEALACGCKAVGTRVGGIPEIIGEAASVPLGEDFVHRFSSVALSILEGPQNAFYTRARFDWVKIAQEEMLFILQNTK